MRDRQKATWSWHGDSGGHDIGSSPIPFIVIAAPDYHGELATPAGNSRSYRGRAITSFAGQS